MSDVLIVYCVYVTEVPRNLTQLVKNVDTEKHAIHQLANSRMIELTPTHQAQSPKEFLHKNKTRANQNNDQSSVNNNNNRNNNRNLNNNIINNNNTHFESIPLSQVLLMPNYILAAWCIISSAGVRGSCDDDRQSDGFFKTSGQRFFLRAILFFKGCPGRGQTWDLLVFRYFSLSSNVLDNLATAPPCSSSNLHYLDWKNVCEELVLG